MSLYEFLDFMGLPVAEPAEDPLENLRAKTERLRERQKRLRRAMIARRCAIERLRFEPRRADIIARHEARYRELLAKFQRTRTRLKQI